VRICEAALSRTEEECQPTVRGVRTGEPVSVAEEAAAFEASLTAAKDADRGRTAEASRRPGKKRIRTLATVRLNAQHLKDTSLFRVSLKRLENPTLSGDPLQIDQRNPRTSQRPFSAHPKTACIGSRTQASSRTFRDRSVSAKATCRSCPPPSS